MSVVVPGVFFFDNYPRQQSRDVVLKGPVPLQEKL